MKASILFTSSLLVLASTVSAAGDFVGWRGLDESNRLGGRKVSEGYLRGKVVLVDRWGLGCPPCRALLPRMEEVWKSFKPKQFVLLGGHCKGWGSADGVKALIAEKGLTYPVYEDAGLVDGEPEFNAIPFLYVVDETGRVCYKGHDERLATEVLVSQITNMEAPKDVRMWKYFIDWELKALPGRAFLRLEEFRKKFPQDAKAYDAEYKRLKSDAEVPKLAKLVAFARLARDYDKTSKKNKVKLTRKKIEDTIKAYGVLKNSKNPLVVQEAKNSIADLKWAELEF